MTRKEERVKAIKELQSSIDCDGLSCWQCRERAIGAGILWADKTMIERAVEWLSLHAELYGGFNAGRLNDLVGNFKQAMEK